MRASYVNPPDLLTPIGEWIAARLPHVEIAHYDHRRMEVFRVYGGSPLFRRAIVDCTRAWFYSGKPGWSRIRVFGWTIYERNREFSGLPGSRL